MVFNRVQTMFEQIATLDSKILPFVVSEAKKFTH